MAIGSFDNTTRAALVVAHPSHELRVHGWLQRARPDVFILTDGSGREGRPRLPSTNEVLGDVGAGQGSIYGRFTDREIYAALLKSDFGLFIELAEELADEFSRRETEYIVADAAEGYNSTHDVCRLLTDAAVEISRRRRQRRIANYEFLVVGPPDECPEGIRNEATWIKLDDEEFTRKLLAARGYDSELALVIDSAFANPPFTGVARFSGTQVASRVESVSREVEPTWRSNPTAAATLDGIEMHRFRMECLRPVDASSTKRSALVEIPFYEQYGEKMVDAGHYATTIRYTEHFLPLSEAVWRHVETHS